MSLTHYSAIKKSGESFVVKCEDNQKPVKWIGSKGDLGPQTNPRVENLDGEYYLYFTNVTVKFNGNYSCKGQNDRKVFTLTVIGK